MRTFALEGQTMNKITQALSSGRAFALFAIIILTIGSLPTYVRAASGDSEQPVDIAPVYHYIIKAGDWAEYTVEEAINATISCDSSIEPQGQTPIAVGDKVRITITSISEGIGYAVYQNNSRAYSYNIPTLSTSLNGDTILTDYWNFIPFQVLGQSLYSLQQAVHPTKEDGYWSAYNGFQQYLAPILNRNFTLTVSGDRVTIHCESYSSVVSMSLGVPIEMFDSSQSGKWQAKLSSTNIMGLIGPPRPKAVAILALQSADISTTSALIKWSQSTDDNFTKYEFYMATVRPIDDPGNLIATIAGRADTSYEVNGLDPSAFYYYTVRVFTEGTYADSDAMLVRTMSLLPDSPLRVAKVDITDPESINKTRPLVIDAREDFGLRLTIQTISKPCTLSVYNVTSAPFEMRPEPWALAYDGRLKVLGNIVLIVTSVSTDFLGELELFMKRSDVSAIGLSDAQISSMVLFRWENATGEWREWLATGGGHGWRSSSEEVAAWSTIYMPNFYAVTYRMPANPVKLTLTWNDVTNDSVILNWSRNEDPDFVSYEIYRSSDPEQLGDRIAQINNSNVTSYNVNGIDREDLYFFRVRVQTTASIYHKGLYADSNTVTLTTKVHESNTRVIIDKVVASDEHCDIGITQTIYCHASWSDDGSDVVNGLIYMDGPHKTNSTGWASFEVSSDMAGALGPWTIWGVYCDGVTSFNQTATGPTITWDYVSLNLNETQPSERWFEPVVTQRVDVGRRDITWSGVYRFDYSPFHGTITFNGTIGNENVGVHRYMVVSIHDPKYSLTSFTSNQVDVIYDRIKIVDCGISSSSTTVNQPVVVWYKAVYEYDNKAFDGSTGTLKVNGQNMAWSSNGQRWEREFTSSDPRTITFKVSEVQDNVYNLTSINDAAKALSVEWKQTGIPGYPPVSLIIGLLFVIIILYTHASRGDRARHSMHPPHYSHTCNTQRM